MEEMKLKAKDNPGRGWRVTLLVLAIAGMAAVLPAQVSLSTVVDMAQKNSTDVRLAEADLQKANAVLAQSTDVYIPSLSAGSTVGGSIGFPTGQPSVANAQVQSLVFSYAQRQYTRAARSGAQAAGLGLKEAREQVALDVSTSYIELDTVARELEAAHQQELMTDRLVSIEQARSEAGVDPLSDLLEAQLTAAQLKLRRLHLEAHAATLTEQLSQLSGMPLGSITTDHASIPEIPGVKAGESARPTAGIAAAGLLAKSKEQQARGDELTFLRPQVSFGAVYNLDSDKLNNYNYYYSHFTQNNFSVGFSFQIPLFDKGQHDKSKQSGAEALRATVEAEQAREQNDVQIASLTANLRELDAQAEVAGLKQQIADEQLKAVLAQLELGNGASSGPAAQPQLSPKAEQLARIDASEKMEDALDAGFNLAKARLTLLRALGHMEDWLNELHGK
jgi:outer membrane protein TolC